MIYQPGLALVHHEGFGFHVDRTAPGILRILADSGIAANARVLDVGCGSGLLAHRLCEAGYDTLGIDASPSMIALALTTAPCAQFSVAALPGAAVPRVDAIVSTGHVLAYLPDRDSILTALEELAQALSPGGVLAIDFMTPEYCERRDLSEVVAKVDQDWAIIARFERPAPDRFVRQITTFVRGATEFQRSDETHENVGVPAEDAAATLEGAGLEVKVRSSFGEETLPPGLVVLVARRSR